MIDLAYELSMSLKVKSDGADGILIDEFLLFFNSNIYPNSDPLQDIGFKM